MHSKFLRALVLHGFLNILLEIAGLVHLRWLKIACDLNIYSLPLFMLRNLQKLELHSYSSCDSLDICGLPQLRNLSIREGIALVPPRSVHHNLERIRFLDYRNYLQPEFRTLHSVGILSLDNFLPNLKKLQLFDTNLRWKDVDLIGTLSKLEELKLRAWSVHGRRWEPRDGGFHGLKFLAMTSCDLQCWEVTSGHFPVLEYLAFMYMGYNGVKEIPSDFADIATLKSINLFECSNQFMSSAKRIQEEQREYGNNALVVDIVRGMPIGAMAFGAVTILMDTLHQHFLQPTPLFPLCNKTKVSSLYSNLSSLQTSLEQGFDFKLGEHDESIKGLEAQLRDVSVELRFQIEHELRLFYLGKSMKLRLHSAQKLLPILNGATKGGIETMDFNCVMEILGKHFTLPVSGMPPHIYKRIKSFCTQHQLFLYGKQDYHYEKESENEQQIDDEKESKNEQQIDDEKESKHGQQIDDDDDDDEECRFLVNIVIRYFIGPVWRVSSQIKKKVKSCFRRERKSDDDEQESKNEQQIDDEQESKNEQQIDDEQESKIEQQIDDEQEAERRRYMWWNEQQIDDEQEAERRRTSRRAEVHAHFKFLRALEVVSQEINVHNIFLEIVGLVHLRLLSIRYVLNIHYLPLFMLRNLQKLQVDEYSSCEPLDLWGLPQLKNITIWGITLVSPRSVHHKLESINSLDYRSCTKELFLRIPNLRTLKVITNHRIKCKAPNWFESLVYLYKVETLEVDAALRECRTIYSMGMINLENFWPNLKDLDLFFTNLKWKDMDVVGKLSKLEKLRLYGVKDQKWKPKDGGFRRLSFLKISSGPLQYWEATSNHFPVLENLDLSCTKLKEIPSDFAEITTLKSINLSDCLESLISSATRIQKEQREYGNDAFVVNICCLDAAFVAKVSLSLSSGRSLEQSLLPVEDSQHVNSVVNFLFRISPDFISSETSRVTFEFYVVACIKDILVGSIGFLLSSCPTTVKASVGTPAFIAAQIQRRSERFHDVLSI
nr:putative disease resistance RPP13-like protein 3 [Ipomoea batatas]